MNPPVKDLFSPNYYHGRDGHTPIAVVIHIMESSIESTDSWFSDPYSNISAHYGVASDGRIHHYVHESDTAFHAGIVNNPSWTLYDSRVNPNLVTIGIENEGYSTDTWTDIHKQTTAHLVAEICDRWNIPLDGDHIIGHYEIDAIRRPNCPAVDKTIIGELIDLARKVELPE